MSRKPIQDEFTHIKGANRRRQLRCKRDGVCAYCAGSKPVTMYDRCLDCLRKYMAR